MEFLVTAVVLLLAAVVAAPVAKRLGLGGVLGYLLAGIAVGPVGSHMVSDVGAILQVSEVGVVMLLFLIGLELQPVRLWRMRTAVLGLGTAQVAGCALLLAGLLYWLGMGALPAMVGGFGLALSSTAMAMPMLAEHGMADSRIGRHAFSILLFQDLAIVPALAILPLFAPVHTETHGPNLIGFVVLAVMVLLGPLAVRPTFRFVDQLKLPEVRTASALLIVVGAALLAEEAGVSASLGAFAAGVALSGSEYRHELQADIEPFKGLLLGLFFMGVGMSMDARPLFEAPGAILGVTALIVGVKLVVLLGLARLARHGWDDAARLGVLLAEGGEFAFVLFSVAAGAGLGDPVAWARLSLAVTLSMLVMPPTFSLVHRLAERLGSVSEPDYDAVSESTPVIICGFGRFGQVVGRILRSRGIRFTALESDAAQVDFVRRFGNKVYYGDPTREDLLRAAGAEKAKVLVVALEDMEQSLRVVEIATRHFPQLTILARARNRRHAHYLMDRGVENITRELLHSSLRMSEQVLRALGDDERRAAATVATFEAHDREILADQHAVHTDEKKLIQTSLDAARELRDLFESDERRKS